MATAPTPGQASRRRARRRGFRVTLYGQKYELQLRDIGPGDEALVRQTTGRPLSAYLFEYGIDTVAVVQWLARRKAGERKLALSQVYDEFPSYAEFNEMVEDGTADWEVLEDVEEDEGAGSVIDVEAAPHPLLAGEN